VSHVGFGSRLQKRLFVYLIGPVDPDLTSNTADLECANVRGGVTTHDSHRLYQYISLTLEERVCGAAINNFRTWWRMRVASSRSLGIGAEKGIMKRRLFSKGLDRNIRHKLISLIWASTNKSNCRGETKALGKKRRYIPRHALLWYKTTSRNEPAVHAWSW
jgi:hypothetical protein